VPNFQKFASAFDPIKKAIVENKESFQTLFNFIGDYVIPILTTLAGGALKIVGEVFGKIIGIIANAIDKIEEFVNKVRDMVNKVIELYNKIPLAPNVPLLGGGGGFATGGAPGAISGGGNGGFVTPVIPNFGGGSTGGGSTGGGSKGGGSANQKALDKLTADAAMLGSLVDQLMGVTPGNAGNFGSFALGEKATMQQYNITVNGAIDSESTARQIVEIINDSSARGTLGAEKFSNIR